jgi:O-acetyl-ADP-ribose deacetylase (regulator of RNase III)
MIIEKKGNIFTTEAQTIVNTINCVGVMGAGIAFEFKLRFPDMYSKYQMLCRHKQIDIGKLWIYNTPNNSSYKKILNFPTKYDWKQPSKIEYLEKGLEKFLETYKEKNITSIAFPILGSDKGGVDKNISLELMKKYLSQCDIDVEIWHFDPTAQDDLYQEFKKIFEGLSIDTLKQESKIRADIIKKIKIAMQKSEINSLSALLTQKGIGQKSLEKLFDFVINYKTLF